MTLDGGRASETGHNKQYTSKVITHKPCQCIKYCVLRNGSIGSRPIHAAIQSYRMQGI